MTAGSPPPPTPSAWTASVGQRWRHQCRGTGEVVDRDAEIGRGRPLPRLLVAVLLLGVADSVAGPYVVLFGADRAHLSPLAIGVFVSVTAVSGIAVSTWLGRRYDRRPSRGPALVAVAASAVGYALLTTTTSYALLLLIAAIFLGTGTAAFPQLFALARNHLNHGTRLTATRGTPVLRSAWSAAWAIGPILGAATLAWQGYTGLFLVSAGCFALVAIPVLALASPPKTLERVVASIADPVPMPRQLRPAAFGSFLFHTAMFSGSVALPLYVTKTLDHSSTDVGVLFSAAAIVEILAALGLIVLPAAISSRQLILSGMLLFVVYFTVVAAASSMAVLIGAQVARGVAVAVVGAVGITYFQDLLPTSAGRATTLFSNTATAGSLVAGIAAGAVAQALGYRAALLMCSLLSVAAWVIFRSARQQPSPR
jgi:MFS transporter, SET family, sugar efflux transporter